jgi:hypothetical protein
VVRQCLIILQDPEHPYNDARHMHYQVCEPVRPLPGRNNEEAATV